MDLQDYLKPLRKWWWLILASVVVATGSSFVAVQQQPDTFRSRVTLMIGQAIDNPNPTGLEFWLSQQLAQTYADIAKREPVQNATKEALGLTWLPEYDARPVPETQLFELTVLDTSPERARAVANELAVQLIRLSPTGSQQADVERQAFINHQLDELEVQIEDTQAEIEAKQAELGELFSARQIADTQAEINSLQQKRNTLQSNYADLLANTQRGAVNSLEIIESATLPTVPVGPNRLMTILTAAAIGFVLAAGAAYLLEYLDDTIKTPDDIKRVSDLPTLAGIARIKVEDGESPLVTQRQPRSPTSEAFRVLRTGVQFSNIDEQGGSLLVTSANPSEGKSVTAANLAVVMAQAGGSVLLVDADLRRPTQHKIFELSKNQGLTNVLLEMDLADDGGKLHSLLQQMAQPTGTKGLSVLTSGPIPPNPSELLGSAKMKKLLATLGEHYDFVIVDSPPVLAVTDAVVLGTQADGALLVTDSGRTRRNQLKQSVDSLREVNAHLIGVTLNRLTPKSDGYYYYYYYRDSYYNREPSGDEAAGPPAGRNGRFGRKGKSREEPAASTTS
jgi:non-specific protein-tyrosine kinase